MRKSIESAACGQEQTIHTLKSCMNQCHSECRMSLRPREVIRGSRDHLVIKYHLDRDNKTTCWQIMHFLWLRWYNRDDQIWLTHVFLWVNSPLKTFRSSAYLIHLTPSTSWVGTSTIQHFRGSPSESKCNQKYHQDNQIWLSCVF